MGDTFRVRALRLVDTQSGVKGRAAKAAFGVACSVRDTVRSRSLTTVRWSEREGRWHHRWPEGRVHDVRRWRSPQEWATLGALYDMDDLLWRHYRPRPGDTVVDVGAGHGGETFWLASMVGPTGRVIAIEAAPGPYEQLAELAALNDWSHVETVHAALSHEAGQLRIATGDDWISGNVYEAGGVAVPAMTLDDLCLTRGIEEIDWLKMNIEGAERDAVRGMERIAPRVRTMTIACHDFLGTDWGRSKGQVMAWLTEHGFTVALHEPAEPWASDYVYASRD